MLNSPRIGALFLLHSTTITNQITLPQPPRTSKSLLQDLYTKGDYPHLQVPRDDRYEYERLWDELVL